MLILFLTNLADKIINIYLASQLNICFSSKLISPFIISIVTISDYSNNPLRAIFHALPCLGGTNLTHPWGATLTM